MFLRWKKARGNYYLYLEERTREGGTVKSKSTCLGSDTFTAKRKLKELAPSLIGQIPPKPGPDIVGYIEAEKVLSQLKQWYRANRYGTFSREIALFAQKVAEEAGLIDEYRQEWERIAKTTWGSTGSLFDETLLKWKERERLNPERVKELEGILLLTDREDYAL